MFSPETTRVLALLVLGAIALVAATAVVVVWRRLELTPAQKFFYCLNYLVARLLWRTEIGRPLPIQPCCGAVIVCNHRSSIDPSFIAICVNRAVHWMVAKEFCVHPAFGWFLRLSEVIPVNRGGIDTAATKLAIRYAREGGLVALFPEGRINTTDELLLPGRPGAALIALKARVPVVPCYVRGSPYDGTPLGSLLMPARVRLEVGQPIDISEFYGREGEREVLETLTRRFLREIAGLAGRPDFQPRLAGRFYKPGLTEPDPS